MPPLPVFLPELLRVQLQEIETGIGEPFVLGCARITFYKVERISKEPSMHTKLTRNTVFFLASGLCALCWTCCGLAAETDSAAEAAGVEALLKTLDPFYKQHVSADGLVIVGSEKVSPYALREVAYLVKKMLVNRPDLMKELVETREMYICVMAYDEMQTDLPECRGMGLWWDYRARGLGGRPCSCGEENVLGLQGDPWLGESIVIHEFAHGLHGVIGSVDEDFDSRLKALYDQAEQSGRFRGYGITNIGEFWAEGVQAWFNCNGTIRPESGGGQSSFEVLGPEGEHVCHIATREQLTTHLPEYAKLLDESFRQNQWVYEPVAKRLDEPHLQGYDPAKAPTFTWPAEVVEGFRQIEAEKAEKAARAWAKVSPEQVAAAKELGVPVALENSLGMRFVLIPAGTFMMGSRDSAAEVARRCAMPNAQAGWFADEHPRHEVTLTGAFYMSIHEVTQGFYAAITNPTRKETDKKPTDELPEEFKGTDRPAVKVSFNDAEKFCKTLSGQDAEKGREYSLPTEAQWEYACRAGTEKPFCFGETISTDQANYHGNYTYGDGRKGANREKPMPVGGFSPSAWGLYDMHGNVSEWCADRYGPYGSAAESDPVGPEEGNERVLRGGSWRSYPGACRSALRLRRDARSSSDSIGFRVCFAVATEPSSAEDSQEP